MTVVGLEPARAADVLDQEHPVVGDDRSHRPSCGVGMGHVAKTAEGQNQVESVPVVWVGAVVGGSSPGQGDGMEGETDAGSGTTRRRHR